MACCNCKNASKGQIRACADVLPHERDFERAAWHALRERVDNAPAGDVLSNAAAMLEIGMPEAAVMVTSKRWQPGRVITAAFMDGDPETHSLVRQMSRWWRDCMSLKLNWVSNPNTAEVRVTFTPGGSWAYMGTDQLTVPADEPTVQFGWLDEYDPSTEEGWIEYRRVIIHEFGHVFNYAHEQSSPVQSIPWDVPKVYEYYWRTQGWDKAMVDRQVLRKYDRLITQYSKYDPDSIMQYPVPNALTLGDFEIGWNTNRSAVDREYGGIWYP